MRPILLALAAIAFATNIAFAHSPLKSTVPADKAELSAAPAAIELAFAKDARVTKVTLTRTVDGTGEEVKLDLPTKKFTKTMSLVSSTTGAGQYQVKWRALGKDGHALKGTFGFTVTGE